MRRGHKIFLGGFGTVVLVFMIVVTFLINGLIVKQTIENKALRNDIENLRDSTNNKINELTANVINTKAVISGNISSLNQNIDIANKKIDLLKMNITQDFSGIIEQTIKSVVTIRTLYAQGTGFVINNSGYIVTNAHVILDKDKEISEIIQIIGHDNSIYMGEYIGGIFELDLALIKINADYDKLDLEKTENIEIGEKVIAIGHPEGLQFSVTDGIVSAKNRKNVNTIASYVQTNAELNQGNSGGPLINTQGKVIGMNNLKMVDTEGIGFALESDKIKLGVNLISQKVLNQTLI